MTPPLEIQWAVVGERKNREGAWVPFVWRGEDGEYTERGARDFAGYLIHHCSDSHRSVRAAYRVLPAWTDAPEVAA